MENVTSESLRSRKKRKLSETVMILKSFQEPLDMSSTSHSHNSGSLDLHIIDVSSNMDENNARNINEVSGTGGAGEAQVEQPYNSPSDIQRHKKIDVSDGFFWVRFIIGIGMLSGWTFFSNLFGSVFGFSFQIHLFGLILLNCLLLVPSLLWDLMTFIDGLHSLLRMSTQMPWLDFLKYLYQLYGHGVLVFTNCTVASISTFVSLYKDEWVSKSLGRLEFYTRLLISILFYVYNTIGITDGNTLSKKLANSKDFFFLPSQIYFAISSAVYNQLSSTSAGELNHARIGLVLSSLGVVFSLASLWAKRWLTQPHPDDRPFGTLTDIYGLISLIFQCIFSAVTYACLLWHVDNPIRLCPLPALFLLCNACSSVHKRNKAISEWIFLLINIGLEISSAILEQISSKSNPRYALCAMLLAMMAAIITIWELVHKGKREVVKWKRQGTWGWLYYPFLCDTYNLLDVYGLVGGVAQCIFSTIQYVCYSHDADNPIKFCLLPTIFFFCVAVSEILRKFKSD